MRLGKDIRYHNIVYKDVTILGTPGCRVVPIVQLVDHAPWQALEAHGAGLANEAGPSDERFAAERYALIIGQ